jgi:hypothetical protein
VPHSAAQGLGGRLRSGGDAGTACGDVWTVPIGLGVNRTFQFGKMPVRIGVEFHYNVERPNSVGADWDFRFMVIPAAPAALFKWMQ